MLARLLLSCILLSTASTLAATCSGVDQRLTSTRRALYADLIAKSITTPHTAAQIKVTRLMQTGLWSAAWGQAPDTERGIFFFHQQNGKPIFKEVWGGYATPEERPKIAAWPRSQLDPSFPQPLADCFALTVAGK
jgi:hypothetical protein